MIRWCKLSQSFKRSWLWSIGVMEYWSIDKEDPKPLPISPILQYSNTPKLFVIVWPRDGLSSFGS
jgi:hypothetical protein